MSKLSWKKLIKKIKIKEQHLIISQKKTRRKKIQKLKMSEYLYKNKNTMFSKVIFSTRARTLDIKEDNAWKYEKNLCAMCYEEIETMEHFVNCVRYGESFDGNGTNIYDENSDQQFLIGQVIRKRCRIRENIIKHQGDKWDK